MDQATKAVERILIILHTLHSKDDVFSGFNRKRTMNIKYDGGKLPNYAYRKP